VNHITRPPQWVYSANFYQIFPDRFARSSKVGKPTNLESWESQPSPLGFKGGDLLGVAERLDYLVDAGFNAIYFCPIFASTANHRYHTHDYFQVDPILGGNKAFSCLIEACRERGVRVVLDGVFNHVSRGFLQFNHALESGKFSPYRDWFIFNDTLLEQDKPLAAYEPYRVVRDKPDHADGFNRFGYQAWWDLPALPKLNTENPAVRKFLLEVARYWLEQGIDGWRLDVPLEIKAPGFWQEFRKEVRAVNGQAYIVAEIWHEAQDWLKGDCFDAVMNYHLGKVILAYFLRNSLDEEVMSECGLRDVKPIEFEEFSTRISQITALYNDCFQHAQMNLLSSHDTPRLKSMASGNFEDVVLALAFLYLCPGVPCIYYGEEIGLEGRHDPFCRGSFPEVFTRDQSSYLDKLRGIFNWRKCKALHGGSFSLHRIAKDVFIVTRVNGEDQLQVVFNTSDQSYRLSRSELQAYGVSLGGDVSIPSRSYQELR